MRSWVVPGQFLTRVRRESGTLEQTGSGIQVMRPHNCETTEGRNLPALDRISAAQPEGNGSPSPDYQLNGIMCALGFQEKRILRIRFPSHGIGWAISP